MKRRLLSIILSLAMVLSPLPTMALAVEDDIQRPNEGVCTAEADTDLYPVMLLAVDFDGGSGTSESPYEISTAEQLAYFAELVNGGQTRLCATLTADINLYGICDPENYKSWTPIGTYTSGSDSKPFIGTFDGGGRTVSGLYINNSSSYKGLFGYVGSGGTVQNLTVEGDFTGGNYSGGVVGYNNGGTVQNCTYNGTFKGSNYSGGVVGYNNSGTVQNCTNNATVDGRNGASVGGVVGENSGDGAIVTGCHNTAAVTGKAQYIGGVVGYNTRKVENCNNAGTVKGGGGVLSGSGSYIGGVVGYNSAYGKVESCYNEGQITGQGDYIGGVVAVNDGGKVTNCYNTATVTGGTSSYSVGGVVGYNTNTVSNCYNTGTVTGSSRVGGVMGYGYNGTVSNCYNTGTVAGSNSVGGVVGYYGGNATVTNCYYLENSATPGNDVGNSRTEEQFKSGEVAYLLQKAVGNIWGQETLGAGLPKLYPDSNAITIAKVTFKTRSNTGFAVKYAHVGSTVTLPDSTSLGDDITWYSGNTQFTDRTPVTEDMIVTAYSQAQYGGEGGAITTTYGQRVTQDLDDWMGYANNAATVKGNFTYMFADNGNPIHAIIEGSTLAIPATANAGDYELTIIAHEKDPKIVPLAFSYGTEDVTLTVTVKIEKATPVYTEPTGLTAAYGQTLADVALTAGWAWNDPSTSVGDVGAKDFPATYTPSDTTNYNTVRKNLSVTVKKADSAVIPSAGSTTITYGDTLTLTATVEIAPLAAANEVEFFVGDTSIGTAAVMSGTATLNVRTTDKKLVIGENAITVVYGGSSNLNLNDSKTNKITVTVKEKEITATIAGTITKTYDGTAVYTGTAPNITLNGLESGDTVTATAASFIFEDANAGTGKTVTVSGVALGGADAAYYKLTGDVTGTGSITKSSPTIAFNSDYAPDKTFDGQPIPDPTKANVTITGVTDGKLTFSWSPDRPTDAGTYTLTASLAGTGNAEAAGISMRVTVSPAAAPPLTAAADMLRERKNTTAEIDLLKTAGFPTDHKGTPVFTVESFTKNGLTNAVVEGSTLKLTATAGQEDTVDTVTVKVSGMKNYGNGTITVTVSYVNAGLVGLTVKTQPKLDYTEDDRLDLSGLVLLAKWSDNTETELKYDSEGVTATPGHGDILGPDDNGKPVTISYGGKTAKTDALAIRTVIVGSEVDMDNGRLLEEEITELPKDAEGNTLEGLDNETFKSAADMLEWMTRTLTTSLGTTTVGKNSYKLFDVTLQRSSDNGLSWEDVTSDADFPTEGLTITLPYPNGTDKSVQFAVLHIFTGSKFGNYEMPETTNTDKGIQFTVTGLSPIGLAWKMPTHSGGTTDRSSHAITISDADHGKVTATHTSAYSGRMVTITVTPDEGYELGKLTVTDSMGSTVKLTDKGDGTYTFTMPSRAVTVTATFVMNVCDGGVDCTSRAFTDLSPDAWYHEGVDHVIGHGLMNGYGNGVFGPDDTLTRAMLAQILYNQAGGVPVNYLMQCDDVPADAWYAEAVRWAASEGVASGYGNGKYGPNDPVTREQLAVMLYRYEQRSGGAFTGSRMFQLKYTDAAQIADWSYEAVAWCTVNGVLGGYTDGTLKPEGQATRAEAAAMLTRYFKPDK